MCKLGLWPPTLVQERLQDKCRWEWNCFVQLWSSHKLCRASGELVVLPHWINYMYMTEMYVLVCSSPIITLAVQVVTVNRVFFLCPQDICLRQDGCQPINEIVDIILSFVSYIGIIVSIIALAMTITTMLAFKWVWKMVACLVNTDWSLSDWQCVYCMRIPENLEEKMLRCITSNFASLSSSCTLWLLPLWSLVHSTLLIFSTVDAFSCLSLFTTSRWWRWCGWGRRHSSCCRKLSLCLFDWQWHNLSLYP